MRRILSNLGAAALLSGLIAGMAGSLACDGGGGNSDFDGGTPGKGGECVVQDDCFTCSDCRLPYDEVCLEGSCWLVGPPDVVGEPKVGSHLVIATFPDELDRNLILSAAVRIVDQRRADGETTTCAQLLADPIGSDGDPQINWVRTLEPRLQIQTTADQSAMGVSAGLGTDRLIFVRLHQGNNGTGTLLALGCIEGVELALGNACNVSGDCPRPTQCEIPSQSTIGFCGPIPVEVPLSMP